MLTDVQRRDFDARGFLRVSRAFTRDEAARMEDRMWTGLAHRHGMRRDDPSTWNIPYASGLSGLKRHRVFDPIGGEAVSSALDELIGAGRWERPKDWGQLLVTCPTPGIDWNVPEKVWHTDFPYTIPADRLIGVLVFSFLCDVPEGGGGTLLVEGSHRLVRTFLAAHPPRDGEKMKQTRRRLIAHHPWLRELASDGAADERIERFMQRGEVVDGVPLRVVELHGEAGDVVLAHPWMLHAGSPNCGDHPRLMCVQRIRPARPAPERPARERAEEAA